MDDQRSEERRLRERIDAGEFCGCDTRKLAGHSFFCRMPALIVALAEAQQTPHAAGGELWEALEAGLALVESTVAHVSHGGPTRADAEKWIQVARAAMAAQTSPAVGEGLCECGHPQNFHPQQYCFHVHCGCQTYRAAKAEHPQPAPERDDYNEPFILAKQRVAIVERIMKLGYIKQTRDTEEGQIRFVARDDVISAIHNVAKVSRAKDCGPHPDDNKKVAGPAPEGERET